MGRPASASRSLSDDRKLKDRAHALVLKGKLDQAIEVYRGLLVANARDANIRLHHAELCRKVGRVDEAVASYLATAQILEKEGHASRARAVLTCGLQIAPGEPTLLGPLRRLNDELRQAPTRLPVVTPALKLVPPPVPSLPKREAVPPPVDFDALPAAPPPASKRRNDQITPIDFDDLPRAPAPKKASPPVASAPRGERVFSELDFDALPAAPPRRAPPVPSPPSKRLPPHAATTPERPRLRLAWSLSDEDFAEAPTELFTMTWDDEPRYPVPSRRQRRVSRPASRRR